MLSAMRVFTACIGRVWRYWVAGAIMFGRSIKIWYSACRNLQIVSVAWILQKKRSVTGGPEFRRQESKMFRNLISIARTMLFVTGCIVLTQSSCTLSQQEAAIPKPLPSVVQDGDSRATLTQSSRSQSIQNRETDLQPEKSGIKPPSESPVQTPAFTVSDIPKKDESRKSVLIVPPPPVLKNDPPKRETETSPSLLSSSKSNTPEAASLNPAEEETERDIMDEALLLLEESNKYWVNGEIEDAIQMLDQAYALLLDTNGKPDIVRQKDDLRLMISKRILAIYNSHQAVTIGKRGEIPIVTNGDVEKEIRQFQTVERDFFISSYQRSRIYRPVILEELKKAGLPEELSWLPLVESGYKITALSPARALGLWQFIPSTGYKYGLNRDHWIDERMDVEKSTRAAIDYLKDLHAMFGDWLTVLAGYNCGEGRVMRTISSQHINYLDRFWDLYQRLPYETARYVPRFLATLLIIRDPQKYGMDLGSDELRPDVLSHEVAEIHRSVRLQDIAQKLQISEDTLTVLNAELRHRMTPDRPYKLKVPIDKAEPLLQMIAEIPQGEMPTGSFRIARGLFIKHTVRRGDTLGSIAKKYKTSVAAIRSANPSSKQYLFEGQRLNVPIRSGKVSIAPDKSKPSSEEKIIEPGKTEIHRVQRGDTIGSLSKKYGISIAEIRRINNLKTNTIITGQTLRIAKRNEETKDEELKTLKTEGKKEQVQPKPKQISGKPPAVNVKNYRVRRGDSLTRIAQRNGMTLNRLLELNGMSIEDVIVPGQAIRIR